MSGRASPIATTRSPAALAAARSRSRKSPPLNRPPRIDHHAVDRSSRSRAAPPRCSWPSSRSRIARRRSSPTGSSACSRPVNPSTARVIAAGADAGERRRPPPPRATSATRCAAEQPDRGERHQRLAARPRGATIVSPSTTTPSRERAAQREQQLARTRPAAPARSAGGSSAFTTAQSSAVCCREDARLRRRVLLDGGVPVEMVRRKVQQHRDPRVKRVGRLRAESCSPRRRGSCPRSIRPPAR